MFQLRWLAESLRVEGYDGIVYRSLLDQEAENIVLFNVSDAKVRLPSGL